MTPAIPRRIVVLFVAVPFFAITLSGFAGDEKIPAKHPMNQPRPQHSKSTKNSMTL